MKKFLTSWVFLCALFFAPSLGAQELNLDKESRAVVEQARKAAEKGQKLKVSALSELAKTKLIRDMALADLEMATLKVVGDAITAQVSFLGKTADIIIFPALTGDRKTSWNAAIRPQNFTFNDIVEDTGQYLDKVTPKNNTFIFAGATENYPQAKMPKAAVEFFKEFLTTKGRLDPKSGELRLDAGFMYMGHLTPDSETEIMTRIRELVGFRGDKVLMVGRLGLGFVSDLMQLQKPKNKEVFVELEATFPAFNADYLPHYIGTTDVLMGVHGDKKKMVGYAIMNMPVTVDNRGTVVDFDAVISVGKNAGVNSRNMIQTWRLSSKSDETDSANERDRRAQDRREKKKSENARTRNRQKKDKENRAKEAKIEAAKKRHAERLAAAENPGGKRKGTAREKSKKNKDAAFIGEGKGSPRFSIYAEASNDWNNVFGVEPLDIKDMRLKITVFTQKEFSIGFYGDVAINKKPITFGNNYYFKSVPYIKYLPIPAIYAATDKIDGAEMLDYCNLSLKILKVREKCAASDLVKESRVDDVTVKIVPPLAAEKDLGLEIGVDIAGVYYWKGQEIAGVFGSGNLTGYKIQGWKTAFDIGPVKYKEMSFTYNWELGKSGTYAFAGGVELLSNEYDLYMRLGRLDHGGYVHIKYFDTLEAAMYLDKRFQKAVGVNYRGYYDYGAVLKADFKQKMAEMVLKDPVLKKLLDEFAKANKIVGPALKWKPLDTVNLALKKMLDDMRVLRAEVIKFNKDLYALSKTELARLEKFVKQIDKMAKQLDSILDGLDEPDPKKLKAFALRAAEVTAEEMGLPAEVHKPLFDLGKQYKKMAPLNKDFGDGPISLDDLDSKFFKVSWEEPYMDCGNLASYVNGGIKPPSCELKSRTISLDTYPPEFDEIKATVEEAERLRKQLDIKKLMEEAYKQALQQKRELVKKIRDANKKIKVEIERLRDLAEQLPKMLKYVDELKKLEPYVEDTPRLLKYIADKKPPLPTTQFFNAEFPKLAPFMTGTLSIAALDAKIKKELRPVEKYFLDVLTLLEQLAKISGDLTTKGTVATIKGIQLGVKEAYKEYSNAVGENLSTGGRLAAYQGELRKYDKALIAALEGLNYLAANNQLVDTINDSVGGYQNEDSLFRIVRAEVEGRYEGGPMPTKNRMRIDVDIAGTGWSAEVAWDFEKGMAAIFETLKTELKSYLEEQTS